MNKINNFYTNNFDLIRLVSALMVLITHCYELIGKLNNEPLYQMSGGILRFSTIGLYCFYFISGYLVSQSLFKTKTIQGFLWKRFLRIYPALIAIVFISVFIVGPIFTAKSVLDYLIDGNTYKYLLTASGVIIKYFLPGVFNDSIHYDHGINGSLWSIALEIKLYICLVLFSLVNNKMGFAGRLMPLVLSFIVCFFIHFNLINLKNYFDDLHCRLVLIFWIGNFCTVYYKQIRMEWYLVLVLGFIYILSFFILSDFRFVIEPIFFGYSTLCISYKIKMQLLKMDISYGIYIYAFIVTQIIIQLYHFSNPLTLILAVVVVVVPISCLSWVFIEKTALGYKSEF